MLWEKWGLNGDLTLTDHYMRYWININTKMKYFWSDIYYFMFWLCKLRLLQFFTKIILITPRLLLYQEYFQTTLSFVNQTPQTASLLRFIPYYSYFQVNKTTQSQNIKATPTLLINFKHSKAILSDNSHCQITQRLPFSIYKETKTINKFPSVPGLV